MTEVQELEQENTSTLRHNDCDGYEGPESEEITAYLTERHAFSFMGYPNFRLVRSDRVMVQSAGEWCDWDPNISPDLRGRLVAGYDKGPVQENYCERHVTEMRLVPEYMEMASTPGWILQRWMAPGYFGSPTEWNSHVVQGTDLPMLGPYPYRGRYILIAGPYPETPSGPFLDRIVEQWEMMRDRILAIRPDTYVRKRWAEAEDADRLRDERWNRDASGANMTAMQSFASTFLEGGLYRQLAAFRAGLNSHYGN